MKNGQKKKWMRTRHRVARNLLAAVLGPYCRLVYGIRIEKFRQQEDRPYLILFNHQTAFDQFFVGLAFRGPIYYVASEDLFSKGWVSSLIRWLVAPIPIKKQANDVGAAMNCLRVAREGGTIAMAPEGNRTYSGKTATINPAIAPLARKLGLPIAFYRIEGGYGVHPRWSDTVRKGKMRGYVSRVLMPEEIADLTNEQLCDVITQELAVDDTAAEGCYKSRRSAEYLERAMYVCPYCGLTVWKSQGDRITCQTCQTQVKYLPTLALEGVDRPFPFRNTAEWYDYQCDFVNRLDTREYGKQPFYRDTADLSEVIVYREKKRIQKQAPVALYGDRLEIGDRVFPFDELSAVSAVGRNKVNFYRGKQVFQLKGSPRFNGLKYVNLYYRHRHIQRGEFDAKFLGL
ncbi:MAG: 1-acyl-sn-glycerol-3-phosphate acyltransferase [Clostridia bacterium]|nr:1-acyl-sn-glycerol-3-phosphate acyltransferase [Clostridia bacterium]